MTHCWTLNLWKCSLARVGRITGPAELCEPKALPPGPPEERAPHGAPARPPVVSQGTRPHSLSHRCSEERSSLQAALASPQLPPCTLGSPRSQDPARLLGYLSRMFFLPKPKVPMKKKQSAWEVLGVELCLPKDMLKS